MRNARGVVHSSQIRENDALRVSPSVIEEMAVMPQPRRRIFGPLTYSTAAISILLFTLVQLVQLDFKLPKQVGEWLRQRALVAALRADNSGEREAAAAALVRSGSTSALPSLLEASHDSRSELRMLACRYLVKISTEPEAVVPSLLAAASDIDPSVRLEAALALSRIEPAAAPQVSVLPAGGTASGFRSEIITALRRLLKDEASATADALGRLGPDEPSAADLVTATRDQERNVRFAAARALLMVSGPNDPSAGQTLVALVGDPDPIADRRAVLDVVMSANGAVQDQAATVLAGLLSDADTSIDADVIDCLVPLGLRARVALPALGRLLDDDDPAHRALAGIAFATIGGKSAPRAIPALLRILDDPSLALEWRQSALGKIRELDEAELVKATPILIRQLASKNQDVRLAAMEMLGQAVCDTPAELPAARSPGVESPSLLPSK
jgi:HEAT repeat protein